MKICLVTGGSRGIGAKTVTEFAENGYTVILNYNNSCEQATLLHDSLVSRGYDVHLYKADVTDVKQIEQMFSWVQKYFKHLDVLVNNAGVSISGLAETFSESDYDKLLDTNAKGTFFCTKYALPLLRKSQHASIVNVSSIWGTEGASCESAYSMSKFAVVGFTQSLALELSSTNVKVNCVCPPIVLTDMSKAYSEQEINAFCVQHNTKTYLPEQVAKVIYQTATGGQTGNIIKM